MQEAVLGIGVIKKPCIIIIIIIIIIVTIICSAPATP